jgi:hypothetical protein
VLVQRHETARHDLLRGEQLPGVARVLTADDVDLAENPDRPRREILEVADRRRDDVEDAVGDVLGHSRTSS